MKDKVQKIKNWISKEQDGLMDANGNFEYPEHEGAYHILCNLDTYIDFLQEEPVSEELEEAANEWNAKASFTPFYMTLDDKGNPNGVRQDYTTHAESFKAGAKWQKENLWKPADGEDLPEYEREVIVLTQPYPLEGSEFAVSFAHRPNKYAKVWNSDLGEEQVVEIERHDKGGWNIPDVKYWLDVELPKEIEL